MKKIRAVAVAGVMLIFVVDCMTADLVQSRSSVSTATVHRSLLEDPNLLAKVAEKNKMTPARFMGQEQGRIMEQIKQYLAEKEQPDKLNGKPP